MRSNDASPDSTEALVASLKKTRILREVSLDAYDLAEGRGDYQKFQAKLELLKGDVDEAPNEVDDWVSDDLVAIVNTSRAVAGLRWRLDSLNKRLGSLRTGNFGFVFARPETGKTTFLASEVSFMATQIPEDAGPVVWVNNEQVGAEVMLRLYQSTLGLNQVQLLADVEGNRKRYHDQINGKLRLKDSASIHWKQIEQMCAKESPSLIVFDQIDKIKGFDSDREDLRLGAIYIWARELAKQYCPVIGVCQADGSGENVQWLTMGNVANAKTAKQAEADWILGIGKRSDPGYDDLRFLHLSKNKLWGDDDTDSQLRHDRWECLIEPGIGRYRDL